MKKLKIFNIDKIVSEGKNSDQIKYWLLNNIQGFVFQKTIERARHYSDLTFYYLEASYICEEVARLGKSSSFKINWNSGYHPVAQFKFVPNDISDLHDLLSNIIPLLEGGTDDFQMEWMDLIADYKENLKGMVPKFPQLLDDYNANLIEGEYYQNCHEVDDPKKYLEEIKNDNPEHVFGFWKCNHSHALKQEFFVSTESWIVPPRSSLGSILRKYSGIKIKDNSIEKANIFSLNGRFYVINESYVIQISYPALLKAFQCIAQVYLDELTYHDQHNWIYHLSSNLEIEVSNFANYVKFEYQGYNVLLWNQHKLTFNDIVSLNMQASEILLTTANLIGLRENIRCDWTILDDELFEELCYDMLYYDPRFDNKTIRKMGKSRSRDGGRDIVVHTHSRVAYKKEKFVFQCKLIKSSTSLSGTKVLNVSDIIEQYEADGYGIFTSGIIDSTLYDKVDAIGKRKRVSTITYSKYELEREIARLPVLKNKYFKSDSMQ